MDCNREEAVRAKQLAEKKMEVKDFSAALKIALKAQQLYPELENISQLILVCEVHCSAEKKTYGTDKDWYGILKVEPSADDILIKKQYRKLALILHPDKNKFSGSTDAFKLIGEAQRVLLDREKRMVHDSKRRAYGNVSAPSWNPKQPSRQSNVQYQHPWNQGPSVNFTGARPGNFQFTPQQFSTAGGHQSNLSTFWTVCPFCSVRYQFFKDIVNKVIHCQSCKKSFTAYELNAQSAAAATTTHARTHTHTQQSRAPPKPAQSTRRSSFTTKPVFEKKETPKAQVNASRKRKKRIEESSESSDSSESSESEEDVEVRSESEDNGVPKNVDKNSNSSDFQHFGEQPRRSARARRNVSYKENVNDIDIDDDDDDDDDVAPSNHAEERVENDTIRKEDVKKVVENEQTESDDKKSHTDDKRDADDKSGQSAKDDDTGEEMEPEVFECPDPEFSDFDKYRKEESFKTGQIWACYDTEDAMPRFYAFIKKVSLTPVFKLQIQWLKPDPVTTDEKKWVAADLPVACGIFKQGKLDKAEDVFSFSHLVSWEAGKKTKTFNIIPRKGETWALFKNWSINWHTPEDDDDAGRKYEYEFVEILSDFDENVGARVSSLEKVKGFVCLFKRKEGGGELVISGSEKYRFAHMVLSCRMSGEEREGVPKGSYELDPASLPASTFA